MKFIKKEKGQSMVEFALVLPVLLLVLCGILDYGWLFYNQLNTNNACREAARYAIVNSSLDTAILESNVKNKIKPFVGDDFSVVITYTNTANPTAGDVDVEIKSNMQILTPLLGTINGSMKKTIESKVVMQVES